ncbi:hypothetical protein AX14_013938 [Amanita brunnescens Koide BX004]|nr:hypothetical protein AX14_013938 [Amanita brunnescens Koide BX004]
MEHAGIAPAQPLAYPSHLSGNLGGVFPIRTLLSPPILYFPPQWQKSKAKATSKPSDAVAVALKEAAAVFRTLQAVARFRRNKAAFQQLATDASELVHVVCRTNRNVENEENLPVGVREGLDRILNLLNKINAFVEKGASRNRFWAFIRAGMDARKIQGYPKKLQQSLEQFRELSPWPLSGKSFPQATSSPISTSPSLEFIQNILPHHLYGCTSLA